MKGPGQGRRGKGAARVTRRRRVIRLVSLLRAVPPAIDRIGQPVLNVAECVACTLRETGDVQLRGCSQKQPRQCGVDVEQLFNMRKLPVACCRVAKEPAVDRIVESS